MPARVIYPINSLIFCVLIYLEHIHDLQEHQYALNVAHPKCTTISFCAKHYTKHFLLQVPSLPIYSSKPNCFHILKCGSRQPFSGLPRFQFLIAYSMQKRSSDQNWSQGKPGNETMYQKLQILLLCFKTPCSTKLHNIVVLVMQQLILARSVHKAGLVELNNCVTMQLKMQFTSFPH